MNRLPLAKKKEKATNDNQLSMKAQPFKVPVYLRVRGGKIPRSKSYEIEERLEHDDDDSSLPTVNFPTTRDTAAKTFTCFEQVFNTNSTNKDVFRALAPHVDASLEGFNSCIFAYGQTGAGKTYTLTGGQTYSQRGLIPRTIEKIWKSPLLTKCSVSYVEIHSETCRDLLLDDDAAATASSTTSIHETNGENETLDLLFRGNMKRMISETYMNKTSSRSHCIFTIYMETLTPRGTEMVAKLHLVDLAGSEDVHKTDRDIETLREGKAINLSLHYLEQIIVSLRHESIDTESSSPGFGDDGTTKGGGEKNYKKKKKKIFIDRHIETHN